MAQRNRENAPVVDTDWSLQEYTSVTFDGGPETGDIDSAANATLTSDETAPSDGDTVTIGDTVYTFRTTLTTDPSTVPFEVLIGVSAAVALDNLKLAIDAGAGEGTEYSTGTTEHETVSGSTNTDTTQLVVADANGPDGNEIPVSTTSAHLTWGEDVEFLSGGSTGIVPLFTVSGTVLMRVLAKCTVNLAGATATAEVGTSLTSAGLIAQTTATDIDANEIWHDATPDASIEASSVLAEKIVSDSVQLKVGTAAITAGHIDFACFWYPLSDGACVEAA